MPEKRDLIIIGSGPAGISTALALNKLNPAMAGEALVLEKAIHPRHKLCGGGVTSLAEQILNFLEVTSDVTSVPIHRAHFLFGDKQIRFERQNLMRIVRRDQFDADLVKQARRLGIEVRENQEVLDIYRKGSRICLQTRQTRYETHILVGADGANSIVRRKMLSCRHSQVSRLLEVLVKIKPNCTDFKEHRAVFDFSFLQQNLQGYLWSFPTLVDDKPYLSVGVFDSRILKSPCRADLKLLLVEKLAAESRLEEDLQFKGHPLRCFTRNDARSTENVLLVGDAAGSDPWLGEGISIALAYGPVAAAAIQFALGQNDFSFADYKQRIADTQPGRLLNRNRRIAKFFYAPSAWPFVFAFCKILEMSFRKANSR